MVGCVCHMSAGSKGRRRGSSVCVLVPAYLCASPRVVFVFTFLCSVQHSARWRVCSVSLSPGPEGDGEREKERKESDNAKQIFERSGMKRMWQTLGSGE